MKQCTGVNHQAGGPFAAVKAHIWIWGLIATGAMAWGVNTTKLAFAEDRVEKIEERVEQVEDDISAVRENISDINLAVTVLATNQGHVRDDVAEMKRMLELALAAAAIKDSDDEDDD